MTRPLLVAIALLGLATPALSHDLQYTVTDGQAVVVRLFYADNSAFSFEGYEIYPEGGRLPIQVGRTDAQGRIAFLPDKAGAWRIKAISEDGHGLDFALQTDAAAALTQADKPFYERYGRIVVGVSLLLGLFGFFTLFVRKRRP